MFLIRRIRFAHLAVILFGCASLLAADETSPDATKAATANQSTTSASAARAEFDQVYDQWKKSVAELSELQIKLKFGSQSQFGVSSTRYIELIKQTDELAEKLQQAAEKAFIENDQDTKLGTLLLTIAVGDLRKDNYDEALRLAKLLLEHKYPNNDVNRIAASAAFAMMQLDEAQKYLDDFVAGQSKSDPPDRPDPRIAETQAAVEFYRPRWDRENKLRKEEAKADDLPRVKLQTTAGDVVLELFENEAPNTVANFISLVEKGFYDGVQFHRVLPNFMAQTGDPATKDPKVIAKGEAGHGGPGYTIADECGQPNHRDHFRGSLSMAHTGQPNSAGSQFFITFVPTGGLDGRHTVFGRVIEGMDVLSKLQRVDPDEKKYNGVTPDKILKAEMLRKREHAYEPKTLPAK